MSSSTLYDFSSLGTQRGLDGYDSEKLRDAHCFNIKMIFYALIADTACIAYFVNWKIEVPIVILSVVPLVFNVGFYTLSKEMQ